MAATAARPSCPEEEKSRCEDGGTTGRNRKKAKLRFAFQVDIKEIAGGRTRTYVFPQSQIWVLAEKGCVNPRVLLST